MRCSAPLLAHLQSSDRLDVSFTVCLLGRSSPRSLTSMCAEPGRSQGLLPYNISYLHCNLFTAQAQWFPPSIYEHVIRCRNATGASLVTNVRRSGPFFVVLNAISYLFHQLGQRNRLTVIRCVRFSIPSLLFARVPSLSTKIQ